jgi:hypothetical protein
MRRANLIDRHREMRLDVDNMSYEVSTFLLIIIFNVPKGSARRPPMCAYALGGGAPPRLRGRREERRCAPRSRASLPAGGTTGGGERTGRRLARTRPGGRR